MKKHLILAAMILTASHMSFANKIAVQGEVISAAKMNSSLSQIGEIKQALLSEAQFKSLNGDCWKLMNGSSLAGTDYGALTGLTHLPNLVTQGALFFIDL